jgi:hypothetical protein
MDDIEFSCECPCACCADGYNSTDGRYDDEEEDDEDDDDSYKKRKTMKCLCTVEKRTANFRKFIEKFVSHCQFNDSTLKSSFLSEIAALEKSIASIDYHPGYLCTYLATVIDQKMCVVKLMVQLFKSSTRNTSFFSHIRLKMIYFHFRFRQLGCRSCASFSPLLCEGCYAGHTIRQRTYRVQGPSLSSTVFCFLLQCSIQTILYQTLLIPPPVTCYLICFEAHVM